MRWTQLFDDLEARLEAEERTAQEGEIADLVRAERARLSVRERLAAHLGEELTWSFVSDASALAATLADVGADWVLLTGANGDLLVPFDALQSIDGLSRFTAPEPGEVARRLGIRVILRGLSRDRSPVAVRLRGGQQIIGTIDRVGADHFDLAVHPEDEPRRRQAVQRVCCLLVSAVVGIAVR